MAENREHHDALFKRILGVPQNAASYLKDVLWREALEVAAQLVLDELVPVRTEFVDDSLGKRQADLIYNVPLTGGDGRSVLVLLEHQRKAEARMALRILRYTAQAFDACERADPTGKLVPAAIALVVFNGERPWNAPVQMRELLDLGAVGADEDLLTRQRFILDDLTGSDDVGLRARPLNTPTRLLLLLLHIADQPNVLTRLRSWTEELRALVAEDGGYEQFLAMVNYTWRVGDLSMAELHDFLASIGPRAEEAYMTTAEMHETEVRAQMLTEQLKHKFGELSPARSEQVKSADSDQLRTWAVQLLDAATVDEVFR